MQQVFENLGNPPLRISLGNVETANPIAGEDLEKLREALVSYGFELIDDTKSRMIEKIKNIIVQSIHHNYEDLKVNYSDYIESHLNRNYAYLSGLFSEIEGTTIEKIYYPPEN